MTEVDSVDARRIALDQLLVLTEEFDDSATFDQRLKVAAAAVRLAECDKTTVYVHRSEGKQVIPSVPVGA